MHAYIHTYTFASAGRIIHMCGRVYVKSNAWKGWREVVYGLPYHAYMERRRLPVHPQTERERKRESEREEEREGGREAGRIPRMERR